MKLLVSVSIGLLAASVPAVTVAQVAQTYAYDANGRLTVVGSTGPGGTNTAAYTYDDANNRTSRGQSGSSTWAALSVPPADQALRPDQALVSPDGRFSLALRASGELELWSGETALWSNIALSEAVPVSLVGAQGDVSLNPTMASVEASAAYFVVQDNGNLVLRDNADAVLWQTNTCCH